ncbi:hypothetical protein ACWDHW_45190 [Streptomyces melanosporofaciens]|uniref:hypothetical protein n=1 Tax=unclassified Streptomyces TaxID=2593676 RepID=UPI00367519AA
MCGLAFRKHNDTGTVMTPNGNPDTISCDEFPFAATYESPGYPVANGGLNPAKNTQSMQPFGVSFAKQFRLLDKDEYWVDPANGRFADCDPSKVEIIAR